MMEIKKKIDDLKMKVMGGGAITFDEAMDLVEITDPEAIGYLSAAAREIQTKFHPKEATLCALINAKSYLCGENCAFCSQSVHYNTGIERFDLLEPEMIVRAAKKAEKFGADHFCVVTSGAEPSPDDFEKLIEIFRKLKEETSLEIDCSVGFLTGEQAARMRQAGVRRVNHNLQTSREFYPRIASTHSYDKRRETLKILRENGLEICAGGILGVGESREDRIKMAFELKEFEPECVPVNILNARPGTPLESRPRLEPAEVIKTIAVFRFVFPKANIKLAGGREANLGERQVDALQAGANGLIVGGYLTTQGNAVEEDLKLLEHAGYPVNRSEP